MVKCLNDNCDKLAKLHDSSPGVSMLVIICITDAGHHIIAGMGYHFSLAAGYYIWLLWKATCLWTKLQRCKLEYLEHLINRYV